MNLGYLILFLVVISACMAGYGAFGIAKYGFRISTAKGLLVLLFAPYTFKFAFKDLQEEDKDLPIALWITGTFVTIVLGVAFYPALLMAVTNTGLVGDDCYNNNQCQLGYCEMITEDEGKCSDASAEEQTQKQFGGGSGEGKSNLPPVPEQEIDPDQNIATTNNAAAGTNNGTNGTNNGTNGGTNNATNNSTNNAAAPAAAPAAAEAPAAPATP